MIARSGLRVATLLLIVSIILPARLNAAMPGVGGFRVLYEAESVYHLIVVAEDDEARYLRFDRMFQSGMMLNDPFESPFLYAAYAHLGLIFVPRPRRVLVIGLGGGSIPKRFWRDYPDVTVDVAELDPKVVEVARRFFEVREDARLRIAAQDGRLFLRRSSSKYDIIILDAYFADAIPFHLTTREFYETVRERLAPGGVLVSNLIGSLTGGASSLFRAMYRTQGTVFPGLYPFPVSLRTYDDPETMRNIILVATAEKGLSRPQIVARARLVAPRVKYTDFMIYVADYYDAPIKTDDVPTLTDDYAPVDTLVPLYRWSPAKRP